MDIQYCYEHCEKGHEFAKKAIWDCESVFDAAFDFECFTDDYFNTGTDIDVCSQIDWGISCGNVIWIMDYEKYIRVYAVSG